MSDIINFFLLLATIGTVFIASRQYFSSHAPVLTVTYTKRKISKENNFYQVTVKNQGNGKCLDAFLLIKEMKKDQKNQYFLSKPYREIQSDEDKTFTIHTDSTNFRKTNDIKFAVIYMDYFGRKFLASDVLQNNDLNITHLERFAKPVKILSWWSPKKWIYKYWMNQAIKQGNTASKLVKEIARINERKEKK